MQGRSRDQLLLMPTAVIAERTFWSGIARFWPSGVQLPKHRPRLLLLLPVMSRWGAAALQSICGRCVSLPQKSANS
jgi:hypothetical protein